MHTVGTCTDIGTYTHTYTAHTQILPSLSCPDGFRCWLALCVCACVCVADTGRTGVQLLYGLRPWWSQGACVCRGQSRAHRERERQKERGLGSNRVTYYPWLRLTKASTTSHLSTTQTIWITSYCQAENIIVYRAASPCLPSSLTHTVVREKIDTPSDVCQS